MAELRPVQYAPGWLPDPNNPTVYRYWDGQQWTDRIAPTKIVGPNHILHLILTVLTFWLFGGWLWIWLIIALQNKQRVVPIIN
ncbi:DUF2510 domain-containing protein [Mycolicibacterium llatzerense]|uniref:DUF2510 domain-containing protein n=1 Tax=Mycolicibacterium llatzerense TaxID=280871 RepID=UPI0008DCEE27|nr:DUF2510 domain-containing protein [Mycolicibacterium llatzerense]